jgi:mRNA-degrading endonuclease RelE of RelBE toxin-antitoxin system
VRWTIRFDREAVADLHKIERQFVSVVWKKLDAMAENPDEASYESDEEDPSLYWTVIDGDHIIFFEIIDEDRSILVVQIK